MALRAQTWKHEKMMPQVKKKGASGARASARRQTSEPQEVALRGVFITGNEQEWQRAREKANSPNESRKEEGASGARASARRQTSEPQEVAPWGVFITGNERRVLQARSSRRKWLCSA